MAFDEFDYRRKWTNPADFPTYEYDEGTVRDDMQALFDEIRDAFNDFAEQADADITELQGAIDDIEAGQVPDGSIDDHKLAPNSVTSAHILDGTIINADIADNTIQPAKLAEKSIPGSGIANVTSRIRAGSIAATDIKDLTITPAKLANANSSGTTGIPGSGISGTTSKIRRKSIGTSDIKNSTVTQDLIANGAVVEGKLASSAVTTGKIADGAVTKEKIADDVISDILDEHPVTGEQIAVGAVSRDRVRLLQAKNWEEETRTFDDTDPPRTFTHYVQHLSDSAVKNSDNLIVDVILPYDDTAETILEEWSKITRVFPGNRMITFEANERPTEDLKVDVLHIER